MRKEPGVPEMGLRGSFAFSVGLQQTSGTPIAGWNDANATTPFFA